MADNTETCLRKVLILAFALVVLGMCWRTVARFLDYGTVHEIAIKTVNSLPAPWITICTLFKPGFQKENLIDWEEFPEDFMASSGITVSAG